MSHNAADREIARTIAVLLMTQKVRVWLDEWRIAGGDSIVHAVDAGLERARGMILVWSKNASSSRWVRCELAAAVHRSTRQAFKIVPLTTDNTPLPTIVADLRRIDWRGDHPTALIELLRAVGKRSATRRTLVMGIDDFLEEVRAVPIPYFGIVGCRKCGSEDLDRFRDDDVANDRSYACVKCNHCGWKDGGEI